MDSTINKRCYLKWSKSVLNWPFRLPCVIIERFLESDFNSASRSGVIGASSYLIGLPFSSTKFFETTRLIFPFCFLLCAKNAAKFLIYDHLILFVLIKKNSQ